LENLTDSHLHRKHSRENSFVSFFLYLGQRQILFSNRKLYPKGVVSTDVNDDNRCDIVVVNRDKNNVGIFLNKGNGTCMSQQTYPTQVGPRSVPLDDVNGDNKTDIVVPNTGSNTISILLNVGNDTFQSQIFLCN